MKARTIALSLLVTAASLWAQTTPPSQKVVPAAKPTAAQAKPVAKPPAAPAVTPAPASTTARPPASPAIKPVAKAAAKPVTKAAKPAPHAAKVKPAAIKTTVPRSTAAAKSRGKRDPFLNPIVRAEGGGTCTTGKKCLAIDSIVLKGIVKSQVGMIAVVESSARRLSYFLRENDPVFNGYVIKITRDSVVFRENVMDNIGRQSTREVVKKVVAPVV